MNAGVIMSCVIREVSSYTVDLSRYANGIYFLKYRLSDRTIDAQKVLLMR